MGLKILKTIPKMSVELLGLLLELLLELLLLLYAFYYVINLLYGGAKRPSVIT